MDEQRFLLVLSWQTFPRHETLINTLDGRRWIHDGIDGCGGISDISMIDGFLMDGQVSISIVPVEFAQDGKVGWLETVAVAAAFQCTRHGIAEIDIGR